MEDAANERRMMKKHLKHWNNMLDLRAQGKSKELKEYCASARNILANEKLQEMFRDKFGSLGGAHIPVCCVSGSDYLKL
jgi:hypothetical protein